MNNQDLIKKIDIRMLDVKRHFHAFQPSIEQAEKLIKKGFDEKKPNKVYLQNALNILGSFISNGNVREVMKMIQIGMKDGEPNGR